MGQQVTVPQRGIRLIRPTNHLNAKRSLVAYLEVT